MDQNDNMVLENHHYEDIVFYNGNAQNLYIKFNSSDNKPIPYYIFLLCDGKIIKTFDEEYTYKVNCMNGDRTFQYLIPNKLLPDSGLHTLQAFAIPAEEYDNLNSYSTKKIRVILEN